MVFVGVVSFALLGPAERRIDVTGRAVLATRALLVAAAGMRNCRQPTFIGRASDLRVQGVSINHRKQDHDDPVLLADSCKAVLTAGLYPNVSLLRRRGKGHTIQGLPVVVHPGSFGMGV